MHIIDWRKKLHLLSFRKELPLCTTHATQEMTIAADMALYHATSWISPRNTVKADHVVHWSVLQVHWSLLTPVQPSKSSAGGNISKLELLAIFPPKACLILIFWSNFHSLPLSKKKKKFKARHWSWKQSCSFLLEYNKLFNAP